MGQLCGGHNILLPGWNREGRSPRFLRPWYMDDSNSAFPFPMHRELLQKMGRFGWLELLGSETREAGLVVLCMLGTNEWI